MDLECVAEACPRLKQLSWNDSLGCLEMSGMSLLNCHQLTELFLDHSCLLSDLADDVCMYETAEVFDLLAS